MSNDKSEFEARLEKAAYKSDGVMVVDLNKALEILEEGWQAHAESVAPCKRCDIYHQHNHVTRVGGSWKPCGHPIYLGTSECEVCSSSQPQTEKQPPFSQGKGFAAITPEGMGSLDAQKAHPDRAESLSGAAPTERYKFETWAEDKGMIVDRLANGSYRYPMMDDRWEVWQAATAQAPSLEKAQEIEEILAYWDCPCCSFPNCGHDHKSEIKQLLQNTLNALRANDEQERKR